MNEALYRKFKARGGLADLGRKYGILSTGLALVDYALTGGVFALPFKPKRSTLAEMDVTRNQYARAVDALQARGVVVAAESDTYLLRDDVIEFIKEVAEANGE